MKIIACLPGSSFSTSFMQSWSRLLCRLLRHGINGKKVDIDLIYSSGANIHHVREKCVVESETMGNSGKPIFWGIDYDYVLWIDSDQVFEPECFEMLINADKDVVAAPIKTLPHGHFNCGFINAEKTGFQKITEFVENDLLEVDYVGFGFILFKRGVFEKLQFPYFKAVKFGAIPGELGEDFSFCLRAKEAGIKFYVDPKCRVLHEKLTQF